MTLSVRLFAQAKDLAGSEFIDLQLDEPVHVRDVRSSLGNAVPKLERLLPSLLIAVNENYGSENDIVPPGARVAAFPPVSGG